jgi:transposase
MMEHDTTFSQRRTVASDPAVVTCRATQAQRGPSPHPRPRCSDRYSLRTQERHSLGDAAPGDGLWLRHELLAPLAGVASSRSLAPAPAGLIAAAGPSRPDRLESRLPGLPEYSRAQGGDQTGANPTDRGKAGTKRHLLVDRQGIPLALTVSGANVHDSQMLDAVEPIPGRRGRPRRRPAKLHADKGYDYPRCRRACRRRSITPRIARRGVESSQRLGRHRWVVERTLAWLSQFRRLRVRYERRAEIHQAFLDLGCALLVWNYVQRFC